MSSTAVRIRFATDVLRRLGEELNPSVDQSVVELVKNSYDADASTCTIELSNVDEPGGQLVIRDDGDGMAANQIDAGWLVLGRSNKSSRQLTSKGRTPSGSKGLGRLAALRLGSTVRLRTWPRTPPSTVNELFIDWAAYDEVEVVEDVPLAISTRAEPRADWGTEIVVSDLRQTFTRNDMQRLARSLILLSDPFQDDPSAFRPQLISPEYEDLESLVGSQYFNQCDFHLTAKLDSNGTATAVIQDPYAQTLYEAKHDDIATRRSGRRYRCPPVEFDFWIFVLDAESFKLRPISIRDVRRWLKHFGGIHLYINGLRVSPYGNAGNDWLDLNLARNRNPESRPSTNTVIGRLRVQDMMEALPQKTDRSGAVENDAFAELKLFAQDAMDFVARKRLAEAERRRIHERSTAAAQTNTSRSSVESAIAKADPDSKLEIEQAFARHEKARDRQVSALRREVDLYRTLSTAGITAATFAHESTGSPIKILGQTLKSIERRVKSHADKPLTESLAPRFATMHKAVNSLAVLGSVTLSLVESDKRRPRRVDIHESIESVIRTYSPFLRQREVDIQVRFAAGRPFLRGPQSSIESITTNLLNNSLAFFEDATVSTRVIEIETSVSDALFTLYFRDNGPGIQEIGFDEIWLPGRSTRSNGTGLGLTIVRDCVVDLGGAVEARNQDLFGGAEFVITLPVLGA
jgi:signal transduction histidine kinase